MLRVGLTGGLGSGKSTVAKMLRALGAHGIEADAVGRALMEPGQAVYRQIVDQFGPGIVRDNGTLDRSALAALAFQQGRRRELSLIVHPAVIAAQEKWMTDVFANDPDAVAVIESALIFEADREGTVPGWRKRFDKVVLVTAPHAMKIERYVRRAGMKDAVTIASLTADAEARIAAQIPDDEKIRLSDIVIDNSKSLEDTQNAVHRVWQDLSAFARLQSAGTKGMLHD